MLLNPPSVASQSVTITALDQTINLYPVCEAWATLCTQIYIDYPDFGSQSLVTLYNVALSLGKVFDYILGIVPQEVTSIRYVANFASTARQIGYNSRVVSLGSAVGTKQIILNNAAVSALSTLMQWDEVLGVYTPSNPPSLGYALVSGITIVSAGG